MSFNSVVHVPPSITVNVILAELYGFLQCNIIKACAKKEL